MTTDYTLPAALARIAELEQQRDALVEVLEDLCAELGECGMTERARAALRAAGEVVP